MELVQVAARTLCIRLRQPIYNFLLLLTTPLFSVVSRYGVEKYGFEREHLLSSGPFRLKKSGASSHPSLVILEKNPFYWDAEHVTLDGAVYIPIMDADERLRVFRTRYTPAGERIYYFLNHGPVLRYKELKGDPELQPAPVPSTILLTVNGRCWPLQDSRVRQALSLAINRQQLVETILPHVRVARSLVPPGLDPYPVDRHLITEDVEQARSLLAAAGFPGGKGFPSITLTIHDYDYMELLAGHLIQSWQQILGITVDCIRLPWIDYLRHLEEDRYDLLYETWHTDIADPCSFLLPFLQDHPANRSYYANPSFNAIMEQALDEFDITRRMDHYLKAEEILVRDMPAIPLLFDAHFCLIDAGVINAQLNTSALLPLKRIELQEEQRKDR